MRKVFNFITTAILVILVCFAGILLVPKVFGVEPMAVLSGSMNPTYKVGSLIYVNTHVSQNSIKVGDPITFKLEGNTVVTHRVVKIKSDGSYVTKGDANNTNDGGSVKYAAVVGVPIFTIPYLGYIATYATSKTGIILLVTLILVILLLTFLPDLLDGKDDEDDSKEGGKTDE